MNDWETGWDPHSALTNAETNIQQLAIAYNETTEVLKVVAAKSNHQQEIIQQLMFQNKKLNNLLSMHRHELTKHTTEIELLKAKLNSP